jgi:glycogen debranching enzyme
LCEVQGYVYAAKLAASRIADVLGDSLRAATLKEEAERFQQRFEDAFWCGDISSYALALDGSKRACRVRASNAGHCLYTGIASRERANLVAHTLLSSDFFTGWGIRTVASGEARYNPISYHNGSVWPHDNALIASGLGRYGFKDLAGQILLGFLDVSSNVEWVRLPELFCGFDRRRGVGPTLYPVACAPQAWAAGSVFMLLEACLGISIDGPRQRVSFHHPTLPQGIPQLSVQGLRVGTASLNLLLQRRGHTVTIDLEDKQGDAEVVVI